MDQDGSGPACGIMDSSPIPAEVSAFIDRYASFLVTGHVRPDGDALGAVVALCRLLRQNGKQAFFAVDSVELGATAFLIEDEDTLPFEAVPSTSYEAVIALDTGAIERIDERLRPALSGFPLLNIDHHVTNTRFGAVNWIRGDASSAGEMVYQLADAAHWPVDLKTAEALWVSLVTDTGRFSYAMTSPLTLRIAADLREKGVRSALINDRLFCTFSAASMELKKRAFATLKTEFDGLVASVFLTAADFLSVSGSKADAEDVIEIPRSLAGVKIALFFYQTPERQSVTRLSIRTREPYDATVLAKDFGGGGHIRAAGCDVPGTPQEAYRKMLEVIVRQVQEQK